MSWMSDEQYQMVSDSREKKSIAASAHKQRSHCGRGGSVKFPSDFLSKKELKAMNGECVKYPSLKKPMTWNDFKSLPDDLKVEYVKYLRDSFNVPDKDIAAMFDVGTNTIFRWFKCLGLTKGVGSGNKTNNWDEEKFRAWLDGEDDSVEPTDIPVQSDVCEKTVCQVVPINGNMTFNCPANQALDTIKHYLGSANVSITVSWHVLEENL